MNLLYASLGIVPIHRGQKSRARSKRCEACRYATGFRSSAANERKSQLAKEFVQFEQKQPLAHGGPEGSWRSRFCSPSERGRRD
jgi:hypothetical protein